MQQVVRQTGGVRFLLLGFLFLQGFSGCSRDSKEKAAGDSNAKPFEGMTVEVAVPAVGELDAIWQTDLSEWSSQSGAKHQVEAYPWPLESETFSGAFEEISSSGKARPDVMLIPWGAVPELISEDGLAEIPEAYRSRDQIHWLGYFSGLRNRVAAAAGEPRLLPISCPVLVCYYRRDLLEQAGLSPPRTWNEYQTLLDTLDEWAPGLTAAEPWGESFRASLFLARAASLAKHPEQFSFGFDLGSGKPLIDNPGFVETLRQANAALARMPEEVKTYTPQDCRREILSGRAALAIGYETLRDQGIARSENLQIGISRLPGSLRVYNTAIDEWVEFDEENVHRVTYTAFTGWALGVSAGLEEAANNAAWELARTMSTDQLPTSYPPEMLSPCRDSHAQNPTEWTGTRLTTSESEQYLDAVSRSLRSKQLVLELPLIGRKQFRAALTEALTKAVTDANSEEAILSELAKEWTAIAERLGKEKVLKSYQRSYE